MAIEIVDFPIKHGDFPWQNVSSPEGMRGQHWNDSVFSASTSAAETVFDGSGSERHSHTTRTRCERHLPLAILGMEIFLFEPEVRTNWHQIFRDGPHREG